MASKDWSVARIVRYDRGDRHGSRLRISLPEATTVVVALFVVLVGITESLPQIGMLRAVIGFLVTAVLPGLLFLQLIGIKPQLGIDRLPYAVGVSLLLTMGVGGLLNYLLPLLGVQDPLSIVPLTVGVVALNLVLVVLTNWQSTELRMELGVPTSIDRLRIPTLLLLLVPLSGILAVQFLNTTNNALPIIVVLIGVGIVPICVASGLLEERRLPLALWTIGITLLLHKSLWAASTYGGHLSVVTIYEGARWPAVHETLLPNAILMPSMAYLLGVGILTQLKVVMPFLVSLIPIALYVAFKGQTGPRQAFLGASFFAFAHPFYFQYPTVPRASIPVLFLGLLGAVISDSYTSKARATLLGILFAAGLAVSHYGTSYYVLFSAIGALLLYYGLNLTEVTLSRIYASRAVGDGGRSVGITRAVWTRSRKTKLLDPEFVLFYAVMVIGWYLFIGEGTKFAALIENIVKSYQSLFLNEGGKGSTSVRLATNYGSRSISLSKNLYLALASLTGAGLSLAYLERLHPSREPGASDEFLTMSALLFVLFGGSFIISGQWGGGRPMMIVLSFNAIFAVVAAVTLGRWVIRLLQRGAEILSDRSSRFLPDGSTVGRQAFAVLIAVFLVINTGVMAALVYGGQAPSNTPNTDLDATYTNTDLQTHVWLTDHRRTEKPIYGDRLTRAQATDWINGEIAAHSERTPYRFSRQNYLGALNGSGVETGYVILLGHNVVENRAEVSFIESRPLDAYPLSLPRRNLVYTTGESEIYATNTTVERRASVGRGN